MNQAILANLQVPLPSLSIQHRIADILSAYDHLIENNIRRIKILEEIAQLLYREWFVNFRFPGYEKVSMVESELGLIPQGWLVLSIDDVCTRVTDGSHGSPKSVEDGYPMGSVKDMRAWGLDIESCRKISKEDYEKLVRWDCKPLKGDILIAKDGNTYLKHMFVIEKELDVVVLSSIAILRPNGKILPHILTFYLLEPKIKAQLSNYVSGVAIPRIILKDFKRFPVVVPELDIQQRFYLYVEPIIRQIHCLIDKNSTLRKTRDLLLPKLISGEIDVEAIDTSELEAIAA